MIGFLEGLIVTLKTTFRRPVTAQYPDPKKRQQVAYRYMGFPALLWDNEVTEPYCTGCMVCIRDCPTQCMTAHMMDNPQFEAGESRRRKIINEFEINLGRCILCGICVDVCNFDAIEMSHEHELSKYERNSNRVDLPQLLEMGKEFQTKTNWRPTQPEKNSGVPAKREAAAESPAAIAIEITPASDSKEDRLAAARARAQAKREAATAETSEAPADAVASEAPAQAMSKEDRLAAARARAQAKQKAATTETSEAPADAVASEAPAQAMSKEDRLAAARARVQAKREAAETENSGVAAEDSNETNPEEG